MTFPAWFAFHKDRVIRKHGSAQAIYAWFIGERQDCMHTPTPAKAYAIAKDLGLEKETVLIALNLLVERGYLVEHARGVNNVRQFTIALTISGSKPNPTAKSA